jgi:hypothetical protein
LTRDGGRLKYAFGTPTLLIYGRDEGISDPFSKLEGVSHWLGRGCDNITRMGVGLWNGSGLDSLSVVCLP